MMDMSESSAGASVSSENIASWQCMSSRTFNNKIAVTALWNRANCFAW